MQMICRDRGGSYADGTNRAILGVPQVADRRHPAHYNRLGGHPRVPGNGLIPVR